MASFAMLPLMDASRDSRIHDWIAEQYSFALSEFQDDHLWRDDPPSLRESKLLPDDFDLITRPPAPPPQRDTDSDSQSNHSYDPPLLPSPLPLLHDAPSDNNTPQDSTDLEDAFHGLLREMNSWRFAPASRSALTLTLSDRNKVSLTLFGEFASFGLSRNSGTPISAVHTADPDLGTLPLPASDCPINTHFFHFSCYPLVLFSAPASALEGSRSLPLLFYRRV